MQVNVEAARGDVAPFQSAGAEIALRRVRRFGHQFTRQPRWQTLEIHLRHGIAQVRNMLLDRQAFAIEEGPAPFSA